MKKLIIGPWLIFLAGLLVAAGQTDVFFKSGGEYYFPIGNQQTIRWSAAAQKFYGTIIAGIGQDNHVVLSGAPSGSAPVVTVEDELGNLSGVSLNLVAQGLSPVSISPTVTLPRMTVSGTNLAPGTTFVRLEVACGTSAHTAALIAYGGTSTVSSIVLNNIGLGVSGC